MNSTEEDQLDRQIAEAKLKQQLLENDRQIIHSIYKWSAPERIYSKKSKDWFVYVGLTALLIIVVAVLVQNFMLILTIIMLVLVMFAVNSIAPKVVEHEITNRGLHIFEELIEWKNITSFWVTQRDEQYLIHVESVKQGVDDKAILLVGKGDLRTIVKELVQRVDYLSQGESGISFINRWVEGKYMSLVNFLNKDDKIITKDPNDSPQVLFNNIQPAAIVRKTK